MERTGWRGQNDSQIEEKKKRNGRLVGAAETSKERAEWRYCQKEKEQSRQSKVPNHEGRESQGGREPHFGEREGNQSESMERKG